MEISKLKIKLQKLLNEGNSNSNWEEAVGIRKEIGGPWRQEDMYWGKSSRLKWLLYGDKNSKIFHVTRVQRRERNKIYRLKDKDRVWVEPTQMLWVLLKIILEVSMFKLMVQMVKSAFMLFLTVSPMT